MDCSGIPPSHGVVGILGHPAHSTAAHLSPITCAWVGGRDGPGAAVDTRGFMGLIYRAEVAWGQSVMTVAAILRRADRVLLVRETRAEIEVWGPRGGVVEPGELLTEAVVREVNEETGLLVERIGPLGRSPGWGLAPHCSAGPAIRAVIGPSSR